MYNVYVLRPVKYYLMLDKRLAGDHLTSLYPAIYCDIPRLPQARQGQGLLFSAYNESLGYEHLEY